MLVLFPLYSCHHSILINFAVWCGLSLCELLPILLEVFMMCGLLRRLSLDTILNLNLPLLACKQGDSLTENRH